MKYFIAQNFLMQILALLTPLRTFRRTTQQQVIRAIKSTNAMAKR
jgi:hypothetical protein